MAVNQQDREAIQELWSNTKAASGFTPSDIPDGEYQFEITAVVPNLKRYGLKITHKVTGGDESQIGAEITIQDSVDTALGVGFFKKRLVSLGIDPTDYEGLDQILATSDEEGSLAAAMIGKTFNGLKKTNDKGFENVYVNSLTDGESTSESASEPEAEQEAVAEEASEGGVIVGSRVTFTSKVDGEQVGEVSEVFEDKGVERVRVSADNGKVYNLPMTSVTLEAASDESTETASEEVEETVAPAKAKSTAKPGTNGSGPKSKKELIPAPAKVKAMRMPDIKTYLAGYGIKADALAKPREFMQGVAGFVHNKTYTPDLTELNALCLGLDIKKGAKPSDTVKVARQKVLAKFA